MNVVWMNQCHGSAPAGMNDDVLVVHSLDVTYLAHPNHATTYN